MYIEYTIIVNIKENHIYNHLHVYKYNIYIHMYIYRLMPQVLKPGKDILIEHPLFSLWTS